jgi:hypothetical protein
MVPLTVCKAAGSVSFGYPVNVFRKIKISCIDRSRQKPYWIIISPLHIFFPCETLFSERICFRPSCILVDTITVSVKPICKIVFQLIAASFSVILQMVIGLYWPSVSALYTIQTWFRHLISKASDCALWLAGFSYSCSILAICCRTLSLSLYLFFRRIIIFVEQT